jgi:hypothetical protein
MTRDRAVWLRRLLLVAIVWLLAVAAFDAMIGTASSVAALVLVFLGSGIVAYCRWRSQRHVPWPKTGRVSYVFWAYLPSVPALAALAGLAWKLAHGTQKTGLVGLLRDAGLPLLRLGVPLLLLLIVLIGIEAGPMPAPAPPDPGPSDQGRAR